MNLEEEHPEIVGYIKSMEAILRKENSPFLGEFLKIIKKKDIFDFYLWFADLRKKNLLPKEIDEPLTNLYWSIR